MFARPHMAGMNDFLKRFLRERGQVVNSTSHAWYCSSLGGSKKGGKRVCADPRILLLNSLINTLIVTALI